MSIISEIKGLFSNGLYRKWLFLGAFFHLVSAIYSGGFHHPDEHFQILEFMNMKMGLSPASDLPWEYHTKMRPWIQPGFYYLITTVLKKVGVLSPLSLTLVFRLISAAIGFFAVLLLSVLATRYFKKVWKKKITIILLNTLWFLPYIHARISSEGVGASFFAIGLSLILLSDKKTIWFLGSALLGISFDIRYHLGIMVAAFFFWLLFIKRESISKLIVYSFGVVFAVLLSVPIDFWGYNQWVFPPIEYFVQNIIEDKASNYGVDPWWGYIKMIFNKGPAPFGIIFIISFLYVWVTRSKSFLTWVSLPFFLVHSYVGHKELRFLYPMVPFLPFAMTHLFEKCNLHFYKWRRLIIFLFCINIIFLVTRSFLPAYNGEGFFKFYASSNQKIKRIYFIGQESPFDVYGLLMNFYNIHDTEMIRMDLSESNKLSFPKAPFWFFSKRGDGLEIIKILKSGKLNCQKRYSNYPNWIMNLSFLEKIMKRSKLWLLYYCEN